MSLSNHVSLTISVDSVGVKRAGFGVPLILSHSAAWVERTRTYADIGEVDDDFAVDTPEYLAAAAMFAQTPAPKQVKIGRAANKPTLQYRITPTAINSHAYRVRVVGTGVTTTTVSFTSDASATVAEVCTGLTAALNGVTGNNYLASDDTTHITVTGDAAGDWFSLELIDVGDGKLEMLHADPGIAADLSAIDDEDSDWYGLYTLFNSNAVVLAAAAWANARTKIYVPDVPETDAIKTAVTNSDTLDDLKTSAYTRVAGVYHHDPSEFCGAAWLGRCLSTEPGSITWKFKTLSGISAYALTSTHRTNLVARSANFNQTVAGRNIMAEGTTADGDFIDVQRGIDWLNDDMSKAVFTALAGSDKIPYTDPGVAVIEAEVRASLQRAVARGILAASPEPTVTVPLVADVAAVDKAARLLPDVKFSGTLAGAVHKTNITGVVTV